MRRLVLVLVLVPALARATEKDAFYAALARAQADPAVAERELLALVERAPQDLFADDALIEAARLDEEELGQPERAAQLYERLVHDYPDSRLALRAERRAQALRQAMGPGGRDAATLARWQDILMHYPERGPRASIQLARELVAAAPDFGQASEVHLWIAERLAQEGDSQGALAELATLPGQGSKLQRRARRLEADLFVARGDLAHARQVLRQLVATTPADDHVQRAALGEALARLGEAQRTRGVAVTAWIILAVLVGLALWRRARALWPPPTLALYMLPVAGLFVAAGLSENPQFSHATLWLGGAMLAIAWLVGAGLGRSGLAPRAIGGWGLGGALAMLAAAYLVIYHLDLFDLLAHTLAYGPD